MTNFEWNLAIEGVKGGPGSGNWGHEGRPGLVGGSAPSSRAGSGGKSPRAVAKAIAEVAKKYEPEITKSVTKAVQEGGGKMTGLEHRIKGEGSLSRKITGYVDKRGVRPDVAQDMINDAVRYTAIFDANNYARGAHDVQRALEQRGWKRYNHQFKNYWRSGDDYDGYNCVFVNDQGFKFELQFHTPESIRIKAKSHVFYEQARELPAGPQYSALVQQMTNLWGSVPRPTGWQDLPGVLK